MKISFIHPSPNIDLPSPQREKAPASWPPLGILYMTSVLRNDGIDVSVLDQAATGMSLKETVGWVKRKDPSVLGFSTLSLSGKTAAKIAEKVKEENPNITILFGNYHATFNANKILRKYPFIDVIVRGEGEYTLPELLRHLERRRSLKKVKGISFRKNGDIFSTPERPLIRNIDSIPFPDRSLLDVEYHSSIFGVDVATDKFTTVLSSRGCPYRCRFCGCMKFAHNVWRPRSVENILMELKLLEGEGYKQFLFVDDNFTLNPRRVIRLCKRMREEKMEMEWICDSRVNNCSYEMLREMVKAGCRMIYFGIESANQRILDYYDKRITPEQSRGAVKAARKAGIDIIVGSFILGAPTETRQEILNTLRFAEDLDIDIPQFNILAAFPGTDIWEELRIKGVLDEDKYWETIVYVPEVSPEALSFGEIKGMIYEKLMKFFLRPSFILKEFLRTLKSSYRSKTLIRNLPRINTIAESVRLAAQTY